MQMNSNVSFKFGPINKTVLITYVVKTINTGAGYDGLPLFVLKLYFYHLSVVMTRICNVTLLQAKFPSDLSFVNVTCIFKGGKIKDRGNYKPISELP